MIKMVNLFKWPRIWFDIFLKPEEIAASLKKEKPGLVDGIISFGFCSFLIGFIAFIILAILAILFGFSLGGPVAAKAAGIGVGLLIMFATLVIGFPIMMIILLLLITIFLKISSVLLKGKGSFSEECGILGVVGSSYLILLILMLAAIYIPLLLIMGIFGFAGFGTMALTYICIGIASLVFSPLMYLLMAFLFDLLADIEQVTIYRSGAILGLMYGITAFIMMLCLAIVIFLIGGIISTFSGMSMRSYTYR